MVGCGRYAAQSQRESATRPQLHRLYARGLWHEVGFRLRRHLAPPEVWIKDLARAGQAWGALRAIRDFQP